MAKTKEEFLEELSNAVVEMEEDDAARIAQEYIEQGHDAYEGISSGLVDGMNKAGELFEEEEYFIPELLACSDAMNKGIEVLSPHIERSEIKDEKIIVIGVVQGDTHDIGKNLVALLEEVAGYKIVDLGKDVPPSVFVERAEEESADVIALSTLMTTTMPRMKEVIDLLKEKNIRDKYKVIVGGAPVSPKFAEDIGADGYSANANGAVRLVQELLS